MAAIAASSPDAARPDGSLDVRLAGSGRVRFILELFGNSAYFPLANVIYELLAEGPEKYIRVPDPYILVVAATVQAVALTRWGSAPLRRACGNLVGPAVYTLIEGALEGVRFFSAPHHLAYWGFAAVIGALQGARLRAPAAARAAILVVEDVVRASVILVMYVLFEVATTPRYGDPAVFLADPSHRFVALAVPLLGLSVGLADLTAQRYLSLLRSTAAELRRYAEFLLGRALLARAVDDPARLRPVRRERAILFIDVRGFTAWCDPRPPEAVVAMLARYYVAIEATLAPHRPIRVKFTADEAMAVFEETSTAAAAAIDLRRAVAPVLERDGLAAGIGIHAGPVVEGLLGGGSVQYYDVLGDTVNIANRIERQAGPGEIWISADAHASLPARPVRDRRAIQVKGKRQLLDVVRVD